MFALRGLIVLLLSIAGTSCASAFEMVAKTTDWYTISVQQSSPEAPPLFLTRRANSVTLERYVSGDQAQMWTTAADFYPGMSPVTSDSGIDFGGLLGCLAHPLSGCPFNVSVGLPAVKIVNREGHGCLVTTTSGTTTVKCGATKSTWVLAADRSGSGYGTLSTGASCLTSGSARRDLNFHTVGAVACGKAPETWQQEFVVQLAGEVSCQTTVNQICFINGNQPGP